MEMPSRLLARPEPNFTHIGRRKRAIFQNRFQKLFSLNRCLAH